MINAVGNSIEGFSRGTSSSNISADTNKAITKWNLQELGWRGFEQLDWVSDITNKYPECVHIAHTCSSMQPEESYLGPVQDLMDGAKSDSDRKAINNYFLGKLGLEELSCRRSGPAGGLCDKKGAFIKIYTLTKSIVNQGN